MTPSRTRTNTSTKRRWSAGALACGEVKTGAWGSRWFLRPKLGYQRLFTTLVLHCVYAIASELDAGFYGLGAVNPRSTISGGGAGVGVAAGADSVAGAGWVAGAGTGVGVAAGGGFTGAEEADGVLGRDGLGAAGSLPAALRTAETNASEACGVGTDPVRIDLKSTMRP